MPRTDLTLDEALTDPIIGALMRADGVDPATLRTAWRPLAARLRTEPSTKGFGALLSDCVSLARLAADAGLAGQPRGRSSGRPDCVGSSARAR